MAVSGFPSLPCAPDSRRLVEVARVRRAQENGGGKCEPFRAGSADLNSRSAAASADQWPRDPRWKRVRQISCRTLLARRKHLFGLWGLSLVLPSTILLVFVYLVGLRLWAVEAGWQWTGVHQRPRTSGKAEASMRLRSTAQSTGRQL